VKKTTFSTGFEKSKLYTYWSLMKYWFRRNREFARHDYHDIFCGRAKRVFRERLDTEIRDARILEIGCGQRCTTTLLFHSLGARVTGIDTDAVDPRFSVGGLLTIWKRNGFERFAKTLLRHILFDRGYYKTLEHEFGRPVRKDHADIRTMDACSLDFADDEFDYVYSSAVFEHIDDVDRACGEVARVLKKGGVAFIGVHLFPSLSGGHNLEWAFPDTRPSKTVPPWDHLRENRFPTHVYLNKLRERDYLSIFDGHLSIVDVWSSYEGEKILTEEILAELPDFSRDELLKRSIKVVMKK